MIYLYFFPYVWPVVPPPFIQQSTFSAVFKFYLHVKKSLCVCVGVCVCRMRGLLGCFFFVPLISLFAYKKQFESYKYWLILSLYLKFYWQPEFNKRHQDCFILLYFCEPMYQICKQWSYVTVSLFDLADETELGKNEGKSTFYVQRAIELPWSFEKWWGT